MARTKIIISLLSIVLVVIVVIGIIAVAGKQVDSKKGSNVTSRATATKVVTSICQPTEFKELCTTTLKDTSTNSSATPKDYFMAAIRATIEEVKRSRVKTGSLKSALAKNPKDEDRFMGCEEYLDFALDDLDAALGIVTNTEVNTMGDHVDETLKWLTAVRVDLTTCLEEIDNPDHRAAMENALLNTTQLTYNAQDIVWGFTDIVKALGFRSVKGLKVPPTNSRRLLQDAAEAKREGYPRWFLPADRKLLDTDSAGPPPNATVANDSTGDFSTIGAALAAYPEGIKGRYVIYVKEGIYSENVTIGKNQTNVFMYGDGKNKTIVTGNLNVNLMGLRTSATATFRVLGSRFIGKSMTFRNTAGPDAHQAVALEVQADKVAIFDCSIEGYQDPLYYHKLSQFYKNCTIFGTVDFIFGNGLALIQDTDIFVRKPGPGQANMVTADGRMRDHENSGLVLQNCNIMPDTDLVEERLNISTYLGRPWKPAAKTIIMESMLGDFIRPEGFSIWSTNLTQNYHETCFFREYANRGPGAVTTGRVNWPSYRVINETSEAAPYTAERFIEADLWLNDTGVPFYSGFSQKTD